MTDPIPEAFLTHLETPSPLVSWLLKDGPNSMKRRCTMTSDLNELAERVERASGRDFELSREIKAALEGRVYVSFQDDLANRNGASPPDWLTSLDAALSLVPEGWWADFSTQPNPQTGLIEAAVHRYVGEDSAEEHVGATATSNPALALTAASLRARAATEKTNA